MNSMCPNEKHSSNERVCLSIEPKRKRRRSGNNDVVHSGHFMSSRVHDDTEDLYSLPKPSPDVDNPTTVAVTEEVLGGSRCNDCFETEQENGYLNSSHAKRKLVKPDSIDYNYDRLLRNVKAVLRKHIISPKWKNFSGCGLEWLEKIRLNNVIWRAWHRQYVRCAKKSMFSLQPASPCITSSEGLEIWKKKLPMLNREYLAWRRTYKLVIQASETVGNDDARQNLTTSNKGDLSVSGEWPYMPAYQVDTADTLFSSSWASLNTKYAEAHNINPYSYQPIMGQMYPEFNFDNLDCYDCDRILVVDNETTNAQLKEATYLDLTETPVSQLENDELLSDSQTLESCCTSSQDCSTQPYQTGLTAYHRPQIEQAFSSLEVEGNCVYRLSLTSSKPSTAQLNYYQPTFVSTNIRPPGDFAANKKPNFIQPALRSSMRPTLKSSARGELIRDEGYFSIPPARKNEGISSSAEERRRYSIKTNFLKLESLLPSSETNTRRSKATILQRAAEFVRDIVEENNQERTNVEMIKSQEELLKNKIISLQNQLPECGLSSKHQRVILAQSQQMLHEFIKKRTSECWMFYIFSLIICPTYRSFQETVEVDSQESLLRTLSQWQANNLSLPSIRTAASNAIIRLGQKTSILTDPSRLPQECQEAAANEFRE